MSQKWLDKQHDEVRERRRQERLAEMQQAAQISAANNRRRHGR